MTKPLTIVQAAVSVLKKADYPLTIGEMYKLIIDENLYTFNTPTPEHVLKVQVARHCEGITWSKMAKERHFVQIEGGRFDLLDRRVAPHSQFDSYKQSIKPEKEYSAFFLETSQPGWGSILEEHHSRQMPFILDAEGFMLFASERAKELYEGLADAIQAGIRHHPDVLRLHAPAYLSLGSEDTSYQVRPLGDMSDQVLSKYYLKDIYDRERLQELQHELCHRSSNEANWLKNRVEGRLRWLAENQADGSPQLRSECLEDTNVEGGTEEIATYARPFEGVSDHGLSQYFSKDINNRENLELLLTELGYRSSSIAKWLIPRVEEQLKSLPVNQVAITEPVVGISRVEQNGYQPFKEKKIEDLESLYWQAYQNREALEQLYEKLKHGSSSTSIRRLRYRVRGRLNAITKDEPEIAQGSVSVTVHDGCKPEVEEKRPTVRLYVGKTTAQLKILHLRSDSDVQVQQAILAELQFFSTPEAIRLRELVQHKLDELQHSPEFKSTDEQADFEENNGTVTPADENRVAASVAVTHSRAEWQKKVDSARLFTYKKRLLEDREPTKGQLAVFNRLDKEAQADFLAKVESEKQRLIRQAENDIASEDTDEVEAEYELPTPKPTMADLLTKRANVFELAKKVKEQASALKSSFSRVPHTVESTPYDRGHSLDDDYIAEDASEDFPTPVLDEPVKPIELVTDFTRPYARVQAMIQKELDRQDFQILLKLSVQDRRLNDVGNELGLSRRDVKRRVTELVERIGEQYADPLKAFAEPMDALLDEEGDEVLLEQAAEKLGLTQARMKFLVMVAGTHFRQPCRIHQDRAYRPTRLLD